MTTQKRSGDPLPAGPPAPTGGDPAGRVLPGCHPSVPLHAAVSEGDFATRVQVYRVQADPRRSRCFCPGHFEPFEKKKNGFRKRFLSLSKSSGLSSKTKKAFFFFFLIFSRAVFWAGRQPPVRRLQRRHVLARCQPSVLSCRSCPGRQQASGAASRETAQDGREIKPQTRNRTLCGKNICVRRDFRSSDSA